MLSTFGEKEFGGLVSCALSDLLLSFGISVNGIVVGKFLQISTCHVSHDWAPDNHLYLGPARIERIDD